MYGIIVLQIIPIKSFNTLIPDQSVPYLLLLFWTVLTSSRPTISFIFIPNFFDIVLVSCEEIGTISLHKLFGLCTININRSREENGFTLKKKIIYHRKYN